MPGNVTEAPSPDLFRRASIRDVIGEYRHLSLPRIPIPYRFDTSIFWHFFVLVRALVLDRDKLALENLALRQQFAVLERSAPILLPGRRQRRLDQALRVVPFLREFAGARDDFLGGDLGRGRERGLDGRGECSNVALLHDPFEDGVGGSQGR